MRKPKQFLALGLAALLIGLTGCGAEESSEILQQKVNRTNIEFSWWGNDERHQYTLKGIDLFEERNPDINVDESYGVWEGYERRNRIAMESKAEADVMQINYAWIHTYSPDGTGFYDLNELSDVIDFSQFTAEDLEIGTSNGHLNALPIAYNMPLMYYNADLFEQYGVKIPETWGDLFKAAEVMREDGIYVLGTVKKHVFLMLQAYYEQITGKKLFDTEGRFLGDDTDIKVMLLFYKRLLDEKVLMPVDDYDLNSFTNQKVAGIACWISDSSKYCSTLEERGSHVVRGELLGTGATDTTGWYIKPATMYAISRYTRSPIEAGKLVNYLLNDPDMAVLQGTEKGVPVSASSFETLESKNMLHTLESESTSYLSSKKDEIATIVPIMEDSDIISDFKSIADEYIYGERTMLVCASRIVSVINKRAEAQ